ncbi:polysaccharide biosynthesis/export family protein [Vibrio maerlii]|uniref:polysaccharide biosynthesis/export family protein n=1 Tax=Vibrio maerlii TaxID=2231648 RepID=UPI000E3E0F73|nr:polysaccharide biosynthesis/export family protein [Vibrio maerlii]
MKPLFHLLSFILVSLVSLPALSNDEQNYTLDTGDSISVQIYGEKDLSIDSILITSDGYFDFPYLGRIKAIGKTPKQLRYEIEGGLKGDYLINPKVMVNIINFRLFYVNGEVRKPGGFEYQPGLTLEKAIAVAGGVTDRASLRNIKITRHKSGKNVSKASMNHVVYPGDIIFVDQSFF